MSEPASRYESVLATRYASLVMQRLWGARHRASVWRRLWLALAEEQQRLGLEIPTEAVEQMRAHLDDVDLDAVRRYEQRLRHDVMAHIHQFADQAPAARPYLHLGATSAFVTDNADLIVMREAMSILLGRLAAVIRSLRDFALRHRGMPTVAYTHFQPAQLTTVGKRATLWLQDFLLDAQAIQELTRALPFRGCKGTTGTQDSYLSLFGGDHDKVRALDRRLAEVFEFSQSIPVSGQTYTRKVDSRVLGTLSGIAQSSAKYTTDLRLLQHEAEVLEPAEQEQVGSSAMPYKRNPMRAERVGGLARYIIALTQNADYTAATQWLERTLDDSANRRLVLPESFLAADAVLMLCTNIAAGMTVNEDAVRRHVREVMPYMATERWLMLGVKAGGDRQALHAIIRKHSRAGSADGLLDRLASDPAFSVVDADRLRSELDPAAYVGRAPEQVTAYVDGPVAELLDSLQSYAMPDDASVTV